MKKGNGKKRLLKRSHHTICTVYSHTEKLKQGYKVDFYTSYVFGGIIQEPDGRLIPTNDLLEIQSKQVVLDRTQEIDLAVKPTNAFTNADEA